MGTKVQTVEQSDFHYDARKKLATALINIKGGADIDDELKTAEGRPQVHNGTLIQQLMENTGVNNDSLFFQ